MYNPIVRKAGTLVNILDSHRRRRYETWAVIASLGRRVVESQELKAGSSKVKDGIQESGARRKDKSLRTATLRRKDPTTQ